MFKSLKKTLDRRLESLEKSTTSSTTCESITRDFITTAIGPDTLQFIRGIHHLSNGELLILTTHKAFASELTMRREILLEHVRERGEKVSSLRIQ